MRRALLTITDRRIASLKNVHVATKTANTYSSSARLSQSTSARMINTPLILTGSSYLMPTLRIERHDNSEAIRIKVAEALKQISSPSVSGVKSMLRGKETPSGQWRVPIILDLAALAPDGSHHYKPPKQGLLLSVVDTLSEFGISVVGLTNTPKELEPEAIHTLGLPSLMSKSALHGRVAQNIKVRLEDVVQMVLIKQLETTSKDESITEQELSMPTTMNVQSVIIDNHTTLQPPHEITALPLSPETTTTQMIYTTTTTPTDTNNTPPQPSPIETSQEVGSFSDTHTNTIPSNSTVFHGSVRSGQQVAAEKGQSLVVIGSVNSGGEVMADGDIFVFGKLRGRALAGLGSCGSTATATTTTTSSSTTTATRPSTSPHIIATSFDPELVCIGDAFTTVGDVKEFGLKRRGVAAMVYLSPEGEIQVESIILK